MRETALAIELASQVERIVADHGADRVRHIVLEIGAMSPVSGKLLLDAIEVVSEDVDVLDGATCTINEIQVQLHCHACGLDSQPSGASFGCPSCGSTNVEAVEGEELILRHVELEYDGFEDSNEESPATL